MWKWEVIGPNLPFLLKSTLVTIELSLLSFAGGGVLGFAIALLRMLGVADIDFVMKPIIDFIRGVPLLVQLLAIYLGAGAVGLPLDPFSAAALSLSINAAAYISEIIRGALLAVPKGQLEAGLAIGLSRMYVIWAILFPQALPVIIPASMGFFIGLIKDTSLAYALGLLELTTAAKSVSDRVLRPMEIYLTVAAIYFVLCFPLSHLVRAMDLRMQRRGLAQARL